MKRAVSRFCSTHPRSNSCGARRVGKIANEVSILYKAASEFAHASGRVGTARIETIECVASSQYARLCPPYEIMVATHSDPARSNACGGRKFFHEENGQAPAPRCFSGNEPLYVAMSVIERTGGSQ